MRNEILQYILETLEFVMVPGTEAKKHADAIEYIKHEQERNG